MHPQGQPRHPPSNNGDYANQLRALLPSPPWCVDAVELSGDRIDVRGWAIAPVGQQGVVRINGEAFAHETYGIPHEGIKKIFWYLGEATTSAFICHAPRGPLESAGELVFSFADASTGRAFNPDNDFFFELNEPPTSFPPPELRKRVHGSVDLNAFRLEGYSNYRKLERALHSVLGRGFGDFRSVLDWGCGCGRMARYFAKGDPIAYTGIDIDSENVAWCREHLHEGGLRQARFATTPLQPPMPLEAAAFDLVIGISVFTHLSEDTQFRWLEELSRVCAPGGVLLLTVLGDASVCRAGLPLELFSSFCKRGYLDSGRNADLDDAIADKDYYRNVFHTPEYIAAHWSRHFDILRILPGYVGNHQDLLVLVKRG